MPRDTGGQAAAVGKGYMKGERGHTTGSGSRRQQQEKNVGGVYLFFSSASRCARSGSGAATCSRAAGAAGHS